MERIGKEPKKVYTKPSLEPKKIKLGAYGDDAGGEDRGPRVKSFGDLEAHSAD